MEKILRIIQNEITSHSKLYFMYVCTCNKCGGIFEDLNPGPESKIYEEPITTIKPLLYMQMEEPEEVSNVFTEQQLAEIVGKTMAYACPECKTDAYLVDNVYLGAGPC